MNRGWAKADHQGAIVDQGVTVDFNQAICLQSAKRYAGDEHGSIADFQEAVRFHEQQGDTEGRYREILCALEPIEHLAKEDSGFWRRLFS